MCVSVCVCVCVCVCVSVFVCVCVRVFVCVCTLRMYNIYGGKIHTLSRTNVIDDQCPCSLMYKVIHASAV